MAIEISRRCVPYTPVARSLADMTFAIVSTAGVHLKRQQPFDKAGDETWREIPAGVAADDLMVTHGAPAEHYDRTQAERDINVIFPIDRLKELAAQGVIGAVAEQHWSMMGYTLRLKRYYDEVAPALAKEVERGGADAVLLTAG